MLASAHRINTHVIGADKADRRERYWLVFQVQRCCALRGFLKWQMAHDGVRDRWRAVSNLSTVAVFCTTLSALWIACLAFMCKCPPIDLLVDSWKPEGAQEHDCSWGGGLYGKAEPLEFLGLTHEMEDQMLSCSTLTSPHSLSPHSAHTHSAAHTHQPTLSPHSAHTEPTFSPHSPAHTHQLTLTQPTLTCPSLQLQHSSMVSQHSAHTFITHPPIACRSS